MTPFHCHGFWHRFFPHDFPYFFCVDGHTCGNPVRMVTGGASMLEGANMVEKRAHFLREYEWIRSAPIWQYPFYAARVAHSAMEH